MIFETQEQVDAALAWWQKALRLQDWTISARIAVERCSYLRDDEGEDGNKAGRVFIALSLKEASIFLLNPADYSGETHAPQDHERTLVHELLHCHFEAVDHASKDDLWLPMEQMIEALAKSFVALARAPSIDSPVSVG